MLQCMHVKGFLVEPGKYAFEILRRWSTEQLRCQQCHAAVQYRHGPKVRPHFAHVVRTHCEYREPETHEHSEGKRLLKTWIENIYPVNITREEYYLEEINQRADILTVFPDGHRLCIELQCSSIPENVLRKRIEGYKQARVSQVWFFGDSLYRGRPINRFRLHSWEDIIRQRQENMLYLLDSLGSQRLSLRLNVTALQGKKTIFTSGDYKEWSLHQLGVSRDGRIILADGSPIMQRRKPNDYVKPLKSQVYVHISNHESVRLRIQREHDFETHPLRSFAISRISDYLDHPVINQQLGGDQLFMIDHRLWQSYLFLTEIYKVYQRRASYGNGTKIPILFIKHILVKNSRFPERPFQIVVEKYVNHRMEQGLHQKKFALPGVKSIYELVYDYFCRLESLGFLRNITRTREQISTEGKMFGRFEVLFDQFCPALFGGTEQEVKDFFRNHSLRYIKNRWFDVRENNSRPLDI